MFEKAAAFFLALSLSLGLALFCGYGCVRQDESMRAHVEQQRAEALQQAYDRGVADAEAGVA